MASEAGLSLCTCSLELFTPRTASGVDDFLAPGGRLSSFAALGPAFVGVSGPASGSTVRVLEAVRKTHCLRPQLHLPRADLTEEVVAHLVDDALRVGVGDVLVIGGVPGSLQPTGATAGRFGAASDLVRFLKQKYAGKVRVAVSGYPRGTCGEAGGYEADVAELKQQAHAGAELIVSMPIFDASTYAQFITDIRAAGVSCPVLPGILPLCEASEFGRICRALHVTPPPELERALIEARDATAVASLSERRLAGLVRELAQQGAAPPHFYTLNGLSALRAMTGAGYRPLKHRS